MQSAQIRFSNPVVTSTYFENDLVDVSDNMRSRRVQSHRPGRQVTDRELLLVNVSLGHSASHKRALDTDCNDRLQEIPVIKIKQPCGSTFSFAKVKQLFKRRQELSLQQVATPLKRDKRNTVKKGR